MILIIGGAHSGKRTYTRNILGFAPQEFSSAADNAPVLYDLQALIKTDADFERLLPLLQKKAVVICNEIGCGVVPIAREERIWREAVGRACCMLAERAQSVIRVQCGIGIRIKGE